DNDRIDSGPPIAISGHSEVNLTMALLLLTRRRTLILTLFPYTTLFRSQNAGRSQMAQALYERRGGSARSAGTTPAEHVHPEVAEDRKSTRLNSSHVAISYAGFCLKKKKNRS